MSAGLAEAKTIRTAPRRTCALCGGEGEFLYRRQQDRLFGACGVWDLKRCANRKCGLTWLDPMPIPEDIGNAYADYYTHASAKETRQGGLLRRIYRLMKQGYLASNYGYLHDQTSLAVKGLGALLCLFPARRGNADNDVRFLPSMRGGRLLDVGCGSGAWLLSMREFGWLVEGVDVDQRAVKVAKQRGLAVRCGALEQQDFASDSFDVVTLNHVIEHVPDPVGTLVECRRILKEGGKLVVCTPNSSSLGHRLFKENWRGLEPPRHLHIFSTQSVHRLFELSGFDQVSIRPQVSSYVVYESLQLHRGRAFPSRQLHRPWFAWASTQFITSIELGLTAWNSSFAECVAAIAVKK